MNAYTEANSTSLKELEGFVTSLTEKQLTTRMPADWTVSGVLGHLTFWDFRFITLVKKWEKEGISPSPIDVDVINEATRPSLNAVDPHTSVKLMLETAHQLDALIDSLDPSMIKEIEERGLNLRLDRSLHRYDHMNDTNAGTHLP